MIDIPDTEHRPRERDRIQTPGRRTGDNSDHELLVVNEADSSCTIYGLGAPGVRLTRDIMIGVTESILRPAR